MRKSRNLSIILNIYLENGNQIYMNVMFAKNNFAMIVKHKLALHYSQIANATIV